MKIIAILLVALVLTSLGFTVIEKKDTISSNEEQLKQEFKTSTSTISPYHQSRKDIATWD
jgi:hypothetical protein